MKQVFQNLKFRYKLLIGMLAITTIALYFIAQMSYTYFYRQNMNEVKEKAGSSITRVSDSLSLQFENLTKSTNLLLVKAPFPQMIRSINDGTFRGYADYFSRATEEASSLIQNQDLINNILICGEDNVFYSPFSLGIGKDVSQLLAEDLYGYSAITVLPVRSNFLFKQGDVIPVSFPLYSNTASGNITYRDVAGTKRVRLILFLESVQFRSYFERMSNAYTYCMYMTDAQGFPLDITKDQYPDAFLPELMASIGSGNSGEFEVISGNERYLLSVMPIRFCDLKAVHIIKKSSLTGGINTLRNFFMGSWLFCLLIAAVLSFSLSNILTRKIKVVSQVIGKINDNSYQEKVPFFHSDEISLLGAQLNQMYDTIQMQLVRIKEKEQKKALAEIQMMSEQINPHFLYNTLECIHFQILNRNTDTAGDMVESLGRYLRITLSVGETMIPIYREIEHITAYMEIMNRHSKNGIGLSCHVDPGLEDYKIMKVLLQPLVENSIKHGFQGAVTGFEPVPPQIEIQIGKLGEDGIQIQVSDNGKGIDLKKAYGCLRETEPEEKRHFGLQNIYKRLKSCYGEPCFVSFSSIPYLKNTIAIVIPFTNGR